MLLLKAVPCLGFRGRVFWSHTNRAPSVNRLGAVLVAVLHALSTPGIFINPAHNKH